jgi:undecaprenyl-diphosphatase
MWRGRTPAIQARAPAVDILVTGRASQQEGEDLASPTRDRTEVGLLTGALIVVLLVLAFAWVSDLVLGGATQHFDERVLLALRQAGDPSKPIGPAWLRAGALDITALGSGTVLGLAVAVIAGFLILQRLRRTAAFIVIASVGGWVLNAWLKEIFARPRPDVVPHLSQVMSLSFPSGHAMTSAVVYLTLGALLMRVADRRATKIYCMACAMFMAVLVGTTRVYLGVHYPSDVLAGWLVGLSWALACLLVEQAIERKTGVSRGPHHGLDPR